MHLLSTNIFVYQKALMQIHFTQAFCLQNNLCEFSAQEHKSKRWFCTQKPDWNIRFKDFWYTKKNLSWKYIINSNTWTTIILLNKPSRYRIIFNCYNSNWASRTTFQFHNQTVQKKSLCRQDICTKSLFKNVNFLYGTFFAWSILNLIVLDDLLVA